MKIPIIFPVVLIALMFAVHYLFYSRVIKRLHVCRKTLKILKGLVVFNFMGIIGYMVSRYLISVPDWLYFIFSLSFAVVLAFVMIGIMYELLHLLQHKLPFDEDKRKFFKRSSDMGILALGGAYLGIGVYEGQKEPMVVNVRLNQNLFSNPYRIVQISDMHIGGLIDEEFVRRSVERINALKADFVAITGDLTDAHIDEIKEAVNHLAHIKSRFGTFYVVGNHEYFHGFEDTVAYIKTLGIEVLENDAKVIGEGRDRFNIAGLYDYFGYRSGVYLPNVAKVVMKADSTLPTLLLMHQPKQIEMLERFKPHLMLSGHTHGGQIFPFQYLVKLQQPYLKGLYTISNKEAIYVNSGIGFWGPKMRLGSAAEITLIEWS